MIRLDVIKGPDAGQSFSAEHGDIIGTTTTARIRLAGQGVLPRHLMLRRHADGWRLYCLDPAEPVWVNEQPMTSPRTLQRGDRIRVGELELEVSEEPPAALAEETRPTVRARQPLYESPEALVKSFEHSSQKLGALLRFASQIHRAADLETLPGRVLEAVFALLPADRGVVLTTRDGTEEMDVAASKRRGGRAEAAPVRASRAIVREAIRSRQAILARHAQRDRRFAGSKTIRRQNIQSALCVPLVGRGGELFGVIHLDSEGAEAFGREDLRLITAIGSQASMALENLRLVRQLSARRLEDQELQIASRLQMGLLPRRPPRIAGLEVCGLMVPARVVGGDYYDFVADEEHGKHYLCIGDVSGKGLPAGLVMVMARCFLRPMLTRLPSTRLAVGRLNDLLCRDLPAGTFMTFLLMCWDSEERRFTFTGAGHERILHYQAERRKVEAVWTGGVGLGFTPTVDGMYEERTLVPEPGDAVVLFTDGVSEARNAAGRMLELEGLTAIIERHGHLSAEKLQAALMTEVQAFIGGTDQRDDMTLLVARCSPS
jgi:serine phosphatase RsbU (regulator of sigma subunit)